MRRALAAVAVALLAVFAAGIVPAGAALVSNPTTTGGHAICTVARSSATWYTGSVWERASCQIPATEAGSGIDRVGFAPRWATGVNSPCNPTAGNRFETPVNTATGEGSYASALPVVGGRVSFRVANPGLDLGASCDNAVPVTGITSYKVRLWSGGTNVGSFNTDVILLGVGGIPDAALPFPADYFTGGTPGTVTDALVPTPTITCSRTIDPADGSTFLVHFRVKVEQSTNATYSAAWAFGDATTSTKLEPNHSYAVDQPDHGYNYAATYTFTNLLDHYAGNVHTIDVTCSGRVDLNHPSATAPWNDPSDDPEDENLCSVVDGWGWLDPTNLPDIVVCLVVPQESFIDDTEDITNRAPFGYFTYGVEAVIELKTLLDTDLLAQSPCPRFQFGGLGASSEASGLTDHTTEGEAKRDELNNLGDIALPTPAGTNCSMQAPHSAGNRQDYEDDIGDLGGARETIRTLAALFMWIGSAFALSALFFGRWWNQGQSEPIAPADAKPGTAFHGSPFDGIND